jgi:dihydroneopterin aldolase
VSFEPSSAPVADRLEDAIDYREIAACVREISDANRFRLLETLATAVADAIVQRFAVARVRVRVRKPDVLLDTPVEHSAVTVERTR